MRKHTENLPQYHYYQENVPTVQDELLRLWKEYKQTDQYINTDPVVSSTFEGFMEWLDKEDI